MQRRCPTVCHVAMVPLWTMVAGVSSPLPAAAQVVTQRLAHQGLLEDSRALATHLLDHQPQLRGATARVAQARAGVEQASIWFPNPSVQAAVGGWPLGPTNPPGLGLHQVVNLSVGVSATLDVLKKGPRLRAAQLALDGEKEARVALLADLMADARQALAQQAWLHARQQVLQQSLDAALALAQLEHTRATRGAGTGLDEDRARLEAQRLAAQVATAQGELEQAAGQCGALLGTPCQPGDDVDLERLTTLLAQTVETADLPAVRALELGARSEGEQATLEGRALFPDPTVTLGYTADRFIISGNNPSTVMAAVSIPIPAFDRGQAREARSRARAQELLAQAQALQVAVTARLRALAQQEATLSTALHDVETQALPTAVQLTTTTRAAYEKGQLTLTEHLLARRTATDVQLQRAELVLALFTVRNERARLTAADANVARDLLR